MSGIDGADILSPRSAVHRTQLERLLLGQSRLQNSIDEVRRTVEKLPDVISLIWNPPPLISPRPEAGERKLPKELGGLERNISTGSTAVAATANNIWPVGSGDEVVADEHSPRAEMRSSIEATRRPNARHEVSTQLNTQESRIGDGSRTCPSWQALPQLRQTASSPHRCSSIPLVPRPAFQDIVMTMQREEDNGQISEMLKSMMDFRTGATSFLEQTAVRWAPERRRMFLSRCLLHPASRLAGFLDGVRGLFLLLDVLMLPYILAWDIAMRGWILNVFWFVFLFWSTDLVLNFCTGFVHEGQVVLNSKKIAVKYIRTRFFLDLAVLLIEGIDLVVNTLSGTRTEHLKAFRVLRFLKLTRLIRIVAKLRSGILARLRITITFWLSIQGGALLAYEHHLNFASMLLKLVFIIVWLGHVGSCLWYMTENQQHGYDSWKTEIEATTTADGDFSLYMHGVYWTQATMFSGSSPMPPNSNIEIFLSLAWVVMGALFVTTITSNFAAILIDSNDKRQEMTTKLRTLAAFLGQRKTPPLLALEVQENFTQQLVSSKPLTEGDVPLFGQIRPELRAALRECQYRKSFLVNPFFRMIDVLKPDAIKTLSFKACSVRVAQDTDQIFSPQHPVEQIILLTRGEMEYNYSPTRRPSFRTVWQQAHGGSKDGSNKGDESVYPDAWISELALFMNWTTVGFLRARGTCEMLELRVDDFLEVTLTSPPLAAFASCYAVVAHELLVQQDGLSRVATDICSSLDSDHIVADMNKAVRGLLSAPVFQLLRYKQPLKFMGHHGRRLRDEFREGQCHLVLGPDGEKDIRRVVRLAVLNLMTEDDLLCVSVARCDDGSWHSCFKLPARKVEGNESPEQTIHNLLYSELGELAKAVQLEESHLEIESHPSDQYGLETKYIKTVFSARLHAKMEMSAMRGSDPRRPDSPTAGSPTPGFPRVGSTRTLGTANTNNGGWMSSLRHHFLTGGRSDLDKLDIAAIFLASPLPCSGSEHAFATQTRSAEEPSFGDGEATTFHIFRWMQYEDVRELYARRNDIQTALQNALSRGVHTQQLNTLLQWKLLALDGREGSELEALPEAEGCHEQPVLTSMRTAALLSL